VISLLPKAVCAVALSSEPGHASVLCW
jgi:hypothetical protein